MLKTTTTLLIAVAAAATVAACEPTGTILHVKDHVEVELSLTEAGVHLLGSRPSKTKAIWQGHPAGPRLTYKLVDVSGKTIVQGQTGDPRIAHGEWLGSSGLEGGNIESDFGKLYLKLPEIRGELQIYGADGELLGTSDFEPEIARMSTIGLVLDREDVRGVPTPVSYQGPVQAAGGGARQAKVLVVPDGYTEDELGTFRDDVQTLVNQLGRRPDYDRLMQNFQFVRLDVVSSESGVSREYRNNLGREVCCNPRVDTRFGAALSTDGFLSFGRHNGLEAASALKAQHGADAIIVVANTDHFAGVTYLGTGVMLQSRTPDAIGNIAAHEIGHALFGLMDEYVYPGGRSCPESAPNISLTPNASALPWSDLLTTSLLPTPAEAAPGTVGAFEGATCATAYRPSHDCMMNAGGHSTMCDVCLRTALRYFGRDLEQADPCGDVTFAGECSGGVLTYCLEGTVVERDCAAEGKTCEWLDSREGYACVTPAPEPSGCGAVSARGQCSADVITRCVGDELVEEDCAAQGKACEWVGGAEGYACTTPPPPDDPDPEPEPEPEPEDDTECCSGNRIYRCADPGETIADCSSIGQLCEAISAGDFECMAPPPPPDDPPEPPPEEEEPGTIATGDHGDSCADVHQPYPNEVWRCVRSPSLGNALVSQVCRSDGGTASWQNYKWLASEAACAACGPSHSASCEP